MFGSTGDRSASDFRAKRTAPGRRGSRARQRSRGINLSVNLAPMIDLTFLLLIFFLVTSTFERAEGILASNMPDVGPATGVPLPLSPIVIRITQTGPDMKDFAIKIDKFDVAPASFEELPAVLRSIQSQPGFDQETPVVILAGQDVRWDHLVSCWNAAIRAGCRRIAFGEP